MESSDASWHSFDPSAAAEDSEEMARLLGVQCLGNEQQQKTPLSSMYWPNHDHDQYYSSAPYFLHHHQPGPAAGYEGYYIGDGGGDGNEAAPDADGAVMAVDFFVPEEQMADPSSFVVDLNLDGGGEEPPACKRRFDEDQKDESAPRKKAMPKKGKNALSKKAQKGACGRGSDEAESNAEGNAQSWASYTSEEESQDVAGASTSSGKAPSARAGRGAATDPQSLYARKRRERINERLKILQNLVPNGTKVDISTMLEEAVQYVKFLQLQIKLLSSDELWMYAPIAYNGVNVGLDLKISPPQ